MAATADCVQQNVSCQHEMRKQKKKQWMEIIEAWRRRLPHPSQILGDKLQARLKAVIYPVCHVNNLSTTMAGYRSTRGCPDRTLTLPSGQQMGDGRSRSVSTWQRRGEKQEAGAVVPGLIFLFVETIPTCNDNTPASSTVDNRGLMRVLVSDPISTLIGPLAFKMAVYACQRIQWRWSLHALLLHKPWLLSLHVIFTLYQVISGVATGIAANVRSRDKLYPSHAHHLFFA